MKWLIWREYRLSQLCLAVGLALLIVPYMVALAILLWTDMPPSPDHAFVRAALCAVVLIQLTPALLGGNAIAGERADRSAQFVVYLPVSRVRRLVSKLSLTLAATVVLWGVNLLALLLVLGVSFGDAARFGSETGNLLFYSALTGLVFFCVSWLISSLQSSPTFAVCGGLITPLVIIMSLMGSTMLTGVPPAERFIETGYILISSIVAAVSFSTGTWYFLRRVEP